MKKFRKVISKHEKTKRVKRKTMSKRKNKTKRKTMTKTDIKKVMKILSKNKKWVRV